MNAQQFAESLEHPVVLWGSVTEPDGVWVALLGNFALPFKLADVTGSVVDGIFTADNLTTKPDPPWHRFRDWENRPVFLIQVLDNPVLWSAQEDDLTEGIPLA